MNLTTFFSQQHTFVKVEYSHRDLLDPGTLLLQSDAVSRSSEHLACCHQVAHLRRLVLKAGGVPDEGL